MRKEARIENNVNIATVQGYHSGGSWGDREAYAFRGYVCNKFFTSDRYIKLDGNFRKPDGGEIKGYGLEIETECRGISNQTVLAEVFDKIIFPLFPDGLYKMQNDGSLNGDTSAECITQVMTKAFIRNHYSDFKTMFNKYFPAFGISADSNNTACGMHVNCSTSLFGTTEEKRAEAIRKLCYIINHHYDFCTALFYRNPRRTTWSGKVARFAHMNSAKVINLNEQPNDHSLCMNLSHYGAGRIEIRLVGGQKNFACFRNTLESVFFLVDRVKNIKWADCDSLVKIFSGCNQYVADRINTLCLERGTISREDAEAIQRAAVREELI